MQLLTTRMQQAWSSFTLATTGALSALPLVRYVVIELDTDSHMTDTMRRG